MHPRFGRRWIALALITIPFVLSSFRTETPGLVWWTTHALEKVRPNDSVPSELNRAVEISAARNEFEPFQVVLRAESQEISSVDVDVSDLRGPNGATISKQNAAIYYEAFLDIKTPSSIEGHAGEWPDALIPRTDTYYGERRNAFPFSLRDRRNQPIWIEFYVPSSAPAGIYHGQIDVTVRSKREVTIPITLNVWDFAIPTTSSLPNSFGMNGVVINRQHLGKYTNDDDLRAFTYIYQKAALRHRISVHGGTMAPPQFQRVGDRVRIDWSYYDREVGPFLDGRVFKETEPMFGAKATSVDLRTNGAADTDELKILYWREFAKHIREKGWFDRLFNYVWDEPEPKHDPAVTQKARLVHTADPQIRNLVTAPLRPSLMGPIDIWSPLVNCFQSRAGFDPFCRPMADRAAYQAEMEKGKGLWWYQSCASHGCYTVGGTYFTGWPSYMVDISPVANRVMEWMTWKYGIQGELYFNINEAYHNNAKVWDSVFEFGGNGDGTLFYPGTPGRIGGKIHIPVESIRLKLIREGLEDYEYFRLLETDGSRDLAREMADTIVRGFYDFEHDPSKLYAARRRMGEELNKSGSRPRSRGLLW